MRVIKAVGFVVLALGAVFAFRLVLGLAMDQMVAGERPERSAVAAAPAPAKPTLAPAVGRPPSEPAGDETPALLPSPSPSERGFGEPDPEYGQADPALAHPALPAGSTAVPASEPTTD